MKASGKSRITRREFIGAAASVTAFTIVPRHVLGGPGKTAPSEKLNVAGIGVGNRGWSLLTTWGEVENHNIVALCDVDSKYLAKASARYEKAKTYRDFRRMLDKEDRNIDAVMVATPDHTHAVATMAALRAGKHVYCEKPEGHELSRGGPVHSTRKPQRLDTVVRGTSRPAIGMWPVNSYT